MGKLKLNNEREKKKMLRSFYKRRDKELPEIKGPRESLEIEKEFREIFSKTAEEQYKIFVHSETLKQLNLRLAQLSAEAKERNELNAKAKKEESETKPGVANE